jgi:polysaccharide biosynthesis transport protein
MQVLHHYGEDMSISGNKQSLHLTDYYYILAKYRWTIFSCLVIVVSLTMLFSFLAKPIYRAGTTLVIEKEQSTSPLTGERLDYESYISQSLTFNTHFKLITSRPVLEEVIKNLNLDQLHTGQEIEINPWKEMLAQFKKNIRLLLRKNEKTPNSEEKFAYILEKLGRKINIDQVRDTRLLRINVDDHNRNFAIDLANSIAMAYIEFNIANNLSSSKNTLSWMTDQLYEMKKKLEDAEEEFLAYKQREKLFSIKGRQSVIIKKIEEFNDAYINARNKRLELDSVLEKLRKDLIPGEDFPRIRSLINNPLIDSLYSQLLESEVEIERLKKVYRPKHPKAIQIQTKIDNTRNKLQEEFRKEIENIKSERSVLLSREAVLQKTIGDFEKEALGINRKELQYSILERNVETNKKLYDTLLSKVKESNIVVNKSLSNIRIAEKAVAPQSPVRPRKMLNFILSVIFGLIIGISMAFLWEYLDRSLRTEEDVQRYIKLPVLSVIPKTDRPELKGKKEAKKGHTISPALSSLFLDNYPINSSFAESYRTLRTNVNFSFIEKGFHSLLITSAGEDEGKTSTVANLAHTISKSGMSVLMVDADLRKTTLSHLMGSDKSPGLTGLISEIYNFDIQKGALGGVSINDLFHLLSLQKKTGLLDLSGNGHKLTLSFLQGNLVDLYWVTRPKENELPAILEKTGLLDKEKINQAVQRQEHTGQRLSFILLNGGFLQREQLKGPLTIYMMEGLRVALQFNEGIFYFKDMPEESFRKIFFNPVDFTALLSQSISEWEETPFLQKVINSVIKKTGIENLFLLPGGKIPPNPSELLSSETMPLLMAKLKKIFDVLIIDSAPLLPASDALLLTPYSDGAVLMVKAGNMNRNMVKKAIEQLNMAKANLIGIVLGQVDIKREGYYKNYHKYYSSYYGEKK